MSHLVSPNSLRLGKTFLWKNSSVISQDNKQQLLNSKVNLATGLVNSASWLLKKRGAYLIRSSAKVKNYSGVVSLKLLYYPLVKPNAKRRFSPRYGLNYFTVMRKVKYFDNKFKSTLKKLWVLKQHKHRDRFIRTKRRRRLKVWITKKMFKGTKRGKLKRMNLTNNFTRQYRKFSSDLKKHAYRTKRNKKFNVRSFEQLLSSYTGVRTRVKAINAFEYLLKKFKRRTWARHQFHFWEKRKYHRQKFKLANYYDIINSLYLCSYIPHTEHIVVKVIQYSLLKLHKRKIRIKPLFYFIDSVLKSINRIKKTFKAFRILITGKIRGGTARTKAFSVGFGPIPRQSLGYNIAYEFGDIKSKYGSFGVKVLTYRN